ncbi:RNA polymerase factor sigma-54 [Stenotrophomonas sp.]|uniref:RNA polymerase factor sigma-54 n=1 Tax=Stenotrophomonas sp. TaxID=69392 RepID=UPI0028AE98F9|nr:RNA polymerase factor sigma-54 [Stenotrophomonas sp.]
MKATLSAQLGQQLHLTPALLQSIRLLQLNGMQLELEVRQALESNPLLELQDEQEESPATANGNDAQVETAAFDELPESSMWDVAGGGWNDGEDDRMARIAAGESTDPQLRVLNALALELDASDLAIASFWLEHCDDAGYLQGALAELTRLASARLDRTASDVEAVRQRLLHGEPAGMAAIDLRECLLAQLAALPGVVPARHLAARLLDADLQLLANHDYAALAVALDAEQDDVLEAFRLILSLQPRPGDSLQPQQDEAILPDVVAWHADGQWRVALNPATTPRIAINAGYERALTDNGSEAAQPLRDMLQEARWLTRGLSMRYDTLIRTARVIVERQAAFLVQGDEAMAPLTLKEVADSIGMHESTVSRITSGKYLQTPRGTFELKHFFAVRLEGASVSGQAVKAMVKRLIDAEPAGRPLADEAIAGLLSRQGVNIARRTVAKYREQLDIAPARERRRQGTKPLLARVG